MSEWPTTKAGWVTLQQSHQAKLNAPTAFLKNVPGAGGKFDTINLDGRITMPTLWEAEFGKWEDVPGLEDDDDLAILKGLHTIAQERVVDMVQTFASVAADDDPSLNADGRLKIAAKVVEPKLTHLAGLAEREMGRVNESIKREQAEIEKASKTADPIDIALHDSIRRHWEGLDDKTRGKRLIEPSKLDMQTLQALATGPAYLGGLSEPQQDRLRTELAQRVAPDRVKRVQALQMGKALSQQALAALDRKAHGWLDFKKARALIEREAKRTFSE